MLLPIICEYYVKQKVLSPKPYPVGYLTSGMEDKTIVKAECPKRLFCKHVKHKGISKILAHQDICKAHKILLSKIAGLERILNE